MTKRRTYTASFKSKVALEALRGELTLPQIADKYGIAQSIVGKWKKAAIQGLPKVFAGNDTISANQREIRALHAKIGELVIEKDFLDNAFSK